MKLRVRSICFLGAVCASTASGFSIDREAFTFTNYDLIVRIEPEQQRLGVRGKITLRNDSITPQKIAVLQISSSLEWRAIKAGDQSLQFVTQPYTSDIDHTGALSEAVVTLPQPVTPKETVELEIAYEGVILLDATRRTRIGTPEAAAVSTDWDQISAKFTAVRGAGFVAWYPIATEAASLSEGEDLSEVLSRWKAREAASLMNVAFNSLTSGDVTPPTMLCGGTELRATALEATTKLAPSKCLYQPLGLSVPAFVVATYGVVARPAITVYNLPKHAVAAEAYADAAEKTAALITEWFGAPRRKAETADLADPNAAPFESGTLLLTPLTVADPKLAGLVAAHQLTHAAFYSPRPWIEEGLAHFAQALYLEQQRGRQTALDYMGLHRAAFSEVEKQPTAPGPEDGRNRTLVNTVNEDLYRGKAMYVWWMLRDMVGDQALKKALAAYRPEQDKEPSYMSHLIQEQTSRDLEWFFDDWVYRDRSLPEFKIESAFPRKTDNDAYLLTITLDNLGGAGAEVPLTVRFSGGEVGKRLEVRAKSKAVIRIDVPARPIEVLVNDGSVPESDTANNTFKIKTEQE